MKRYLVCLAALPCIANAEFVQRTSITGDSTNRVQLELGYQFNDVLGTSLGTGLHKGWDKFSVFVNQHATYKSSELTYFDTTVGVGVDNVIGRKDWFLRSGLTTGLSQDKLKAGMGAAWKYSFRTNEFSIAPVMEVSISL